MSGPSITGNLYLAGRNDLALLRHAAAKFAVKKITSLDAAQGRYFWIGYIDSAWKAQLTPKEIFEKRWCETELELNAKDRFQSVTLFRVQCSQGKPITTGFHLPIKRF
jgi:hypothetical protein